MPNSNERSSFDKIRSLTEDTFAPLVLESRGRVAVEFMSYGCGYCREIEPVLQQAVGRLESSEIIFRVNVPAEPGIAASYDIQATPTFVMFLDGVEVGRSVGPTSSMRGVVDALTQPFESLE